MGLLEPLLTMVAWAASYRNRLCQQVSPYDISNTIQVRQPKRSRRQVREARKKGEANVMAWRGPALWASLEPSAFPFSWIMKM